MAKSLEELKAATARMLDDARAAGETIGHAATELDRLASELKEIDAELNGPETPTPEQIEGWAVRLPQIQAAILQMNARVNYGLRSQLIVLSLLFGVGLILHIALLDLVFTGAFKHPDGELHIFPWFGLKGFEVSVAAAQLVSMSVLAAIWGAAGGIVATIIAMAEGAAGLYSPRFGLSWIVKPLRGSFVGVMIFMLVQAGLLTAGADAAEASNAGLPFEVSPRQVFFIFALSGLAGFQERAVLQKINDVLKAVLGSSGDGQGSGGSKVGAGG